MKELLLNLPKTDKPKYRVLCDEIRNAIRVGQIKPGETLPSSRDLSNRLKINRHTVMAAIKELEAEGWVHSFEKRFYQVTKELPDKFLKSKAIIKKQIPIIRKTAEFARKVEIGDYRSPLYGKHSFPSGSPDLRQFPVSELKSFYYDSLRSGKSLSYGDPKGHEGLIEQIQIYLRRVRNIEGKEIVVTNGSQEAIFLISQLFSKPGDFVAVEELGYPPAIRALEYAGAKILPIPVDKDGIVVEQFEKLAKNKPIKLLYITPLHQYPTTVTLSAHRRLHLYEVAAKYGIQILEDDYDHEFHYSSQPVAPLASFDPAETVLYVSTFSKILFPSSRLGFMAVSKEVARQIAKLKRIMSRQNEQILQDVVARWMKDGGFERHLRKMRRLYGSRLSEFIYSLEKHKLKHPQISWQTPDGGMAIWLNLNQDSTKFAEKARPHGVILNPEQLYRLDGTSGTHIRLGFSGQTSEENNKALNALCELL